MLIVAAEAVVGCLRPELEAVPVVAAAAALTAVVASPGAFPAESSLQADRERAELVPPPVPPDPRSRLCFLLSLPRR